MGFLDKFKKGFKAKPADDTAKVKSVVAKKEVKEVSEKEKRSEPEKKQKTIREEVEHSQGKPKKGIRPGVYGHRVLMSPVISEKSAHLHTFNQYIFRIAPDANKVMVKKAIFEVYHSEPREVKIINMPGKSVTRGVHHGRTKSYKKAIVTMPKGVTLPVYEGV